MKVKQLAIWIAFGAGALFVSASAQNAVPPPNLVAQHAIENRKAVFTLIGNNFRPVGEILRGASSYESVEVDKYAARVAFLTGLLPEAFPDVSRGGDTRALAEVWLNRADFDKRLKDFTQHAVALAQVVSQRGGNSEAFKNAARAVVEDCKGCHDSYRAK
jgi:cytochrome c556